MKISQKMGSGCGETAVCEAVMKNKEPLSEARLWGGKRGEQCISQEVRSDMNVSSLLLSSLNAYF